MTPHIWHACAPWIARNHRKLSRAAVILLLLAVLIGIGVAVADLPNRLLLLAFSSIAGAFGLLCLGMIEQWFKAPPPSFSANPAKLLFLWSGAVFYAAFLLISLGFFGVGIVGLIYQ